jgi:hypothetical protein
MLGLPSDVEADAPTARWASFGTNTESTMSIDDNGVDYDYDFPLILVVPTAKEFPTSRHSTNPYADRTTAPALGQIHPHDKRSFVLRPRCRYQARSLLLKTSGALPLSGEHKHRFTARQSSVDSTPRVVEYMTDATRNHQTPPSFYHSPVRLRIRRDFHSSPSFNSPRILPLRVRCQQPLQQEQSFGPGESRYNIPTERSLPLIPLLC